MLCTTENRGQTHPHAHSRIRKLSNTVVTLTSRKSLRPRSMTSVSIITILFLFLRQYVMYFALHHLYRRVRN